ncbi:MULTISPECIES: hypothetical protein [Hydrogenophaga]|uniref:DUF4936 domain-containing protein n=1 Tax=Hydrogenophaga electricum TaxID=1230953 RepID=A0ABQ6BXD3_9BURK|nr:MULTISPECIES: hypothetical protein [Hydrogenophaga]GLS12843.1 hypothetical protein GCM10007935_02710 [Hydrogenophaga electricum]
MTYQLKLYVPEGASPADTAQAEARFRAALESVLGDAAMVWPVYAAVQRIRMTHGDPPDSEALSVDERTVVELWAQAETAALEAVWGPHRHLDEGGYDIAPASGA